MTTGDLHRDRGSVLSIDCLGYSPKVDRLHWRKCEKQQLDNTSLWVREGDALPKYDRCDLVCLQF